MKANQFTGCVKKVQENAARNENRHEFALNAAISKRGNLLRVDPSECFRYDEIHGRLAQRLERSVYTRKVVRSNRTAPTIPNIPTVSPRLSGLDRIARSFKFVARKTLVPIVSGQHASASCGCVSLRL